MELVFYPGLLWDIHTHVPFDKIENEILNYRRITEFGELGVDCLIDSHYISFIGSEESAKRFADWLDKHLDEIYPGHGRCVLKQCSPHGVSTDEITRQIEDYFSSHT